MSLSERYFRWKFVRRWKKKLMTEWHLNYENWLIVKDMPDAMTIVHRATGKIRVIKKAVKE